jgi:hypothetical protein
MNCKTARGLFSLRIDEGLSYEEQRRLTQHLDSCSQCAEEYTGLRRTVSLLRGLPEAEASSTFLQDVLRAARNSRSEDSSIARAPGIWDRLRGWTSATVLEPTPRWAMAALTLGLIVGVSGSMLIFHRSSIPAVAQQTEVAVAPQTAAVAPASPAAVSPAGMPTGPFEDLVQEMLHRAESTPPGGTDSSSTPNPDWGAGWDPGVHGQAVGLGPAAPKGRGREGSVSIVF